MDKGINFDRVNWLVNVPANDINFKSNLERSNAETIGAALESVPENHKTKTKMLRSRLTQLEKENQMAGRKEKEPRAHDAEAEAASQIYQVAKEESEKQLAAMREEMDAVRVESQAAGAIYAIETNIAFQELLKATTLHNVKQSKEYRKGGLTWDAFCDSLGMERRTVDRMLDDFRPIMDSFSDKIVQFSGMPFSKIRLLGKQLSDNLSEIKDNCLIYGDESIPLSPEYRDDIQALIERISEESKEKIEEAEAKLSAKDKVLKSKEDLLNKQERSLRRFEKEAKQRGLTPEESAVLDRIDMLKTVLNGHCLQIENVFVTLNNDPFPAAVAAFVSLLDEIRSRVGAMRESTITCLAPAGMFPDEEWQPTLPAQSTED